MIPLRDNIPALTTPVVNYAIIAITSLVFFAQLQDVAGQPSLVEKYGMIPVRIQNPDASFELVVGQRIVKTPQGPEVQPVKREAIPPVISPYVTMLTCIFLHGGWMHFLFNMWFLYIFGDNVEDRFGHVGYAIFYLGCGVAASLMHFLSGPGSTIPTVGASGAIAGVMGAYLIWYPHAKVQTLIPIFIVMYIVELPASLFLGVWFLIQFLQGTMSVIIMQATGVAWWAHIGGFVAGIFVAWMFGVKSWARPENPNHRPHIERVSKN